MKYSTASLQNLCLREIIMSLEYYTPELLACLPPTLRRPLLVKMPIVDLCQLENTCVFDGVDAEEVWKERYKKQTLKYGHCAFSGANFDTAQYLGSNCYHRSIVTDSMGLLDKYQTTRQKYFAGIVYSIFDSARPTGYYECNHGAATFEDIDLKRSGLVDHPVDLVNYLVAAARIKRVLVTRELSDKSYFTNPDNIYFGSPLMHFELTLFLSPFMHQYNYWAYMKTNELRQEVPPRYSSFLNEENHCRLSEEDALTLLIEKCDYQITDVYINIDKYRDYIIIGRKLPNPETKTLVADFFSNLHKLELCCTSLEADLTSPVDIVLRDFLNNFTYSPKYEKHLRSLSLLDLDYGTVNAVSRLLPGPYCQIEELVLKECELNSKSQSGLSFSDILIQLSNLSIFEASCRNNQPIQGSESTSAIINLLQRPHFKRLTLKGILLSGRELKSLVETFLTTPCSHDQSVEIHTHITAPITESAYSNLDLIPPSTHEYKSLEIHTLSGDTGTTINSWLLSIQSLSLKRLCISTVKSSISTLSLAANNTSLQVNHLLLHRTDFSADNFLNLLLNKSLKELEFVPNGPVSLTDITSGLMTIAESQTLEALTVSSSTNFGYNPLAEMFGYVELSSRAEIEQFGNVLFPLQHLNKFSLELSILTPVDQYSVGVTEFFEALFNSWEKSKRPKIKRFALNFVNKITAQSPQSLDENSQYMADQIGIEVKFKLFYFRVTS